MRTKGRGYKKGLSGGGENNLEHDVCGSEEKVKRPSFGEEEKEEHHSNDDARGL